MMRPSDLAPVLIHDRVRTQFQDLMIPAWLTRCIHGLRKIGCLGRVDCCEPKAPYAAVQRLVPSDTRAALAVGLGTRESL